MHIRRHVRDREPLFLLSICQRDNVFSPKVWFSDEIIYSARSECQGYKFATPVSAPLEGAAKLHSPNKLYGRAPHTGIGKVR
jgi:hypothetical protein